MKFAQFAAQLHQLEKTSSRLEMTEQLAQLYRQLDVKEIAPATYLMQGRLVPTYESLEFNLSSKMILRSLAKFFEIHQSKLSDSPKSQHNLFGEENSSHLSELVKKQYQQSGDLGETTEKIVIKIRGDLNQDLNILEVFIELTKIAHLEGKGSQEQKVNQLVSLWERISPLSAKYVTRIIMGKVRLGFSTMTLLDALSWAITGDKSTRDQLETAYNKRADVGQLATEYLSTKNERQRQQVLSTYTVKNGVPVVPALAQRLNSTDEVISKMKSVIVEPKYDGLRVQIHFQQGQPIKVFTRSLEDISLMFPELAEAADILKADSCILDGEAIGYDSQTGQLLPFQQTVTRRRKHEIAAQANKVPIRFYVFDVLEKDGKSQIDQPLRDRKQILSSLFTDNSVFYETEFLMSDQPSELKKYHQLQLSKGLEGAIFKKIDSNYRGGRKGWRWVKMKEVEGQRGKLHDTLDCVVMGYYLGKGKRAEFGIGAILVGIRDAGSDKIKTLTKIGTGLTDDQFKQMKELADQHQVGQKPTNYQVNKSLFPDVWTQPEIVIEVAADEITTSPAHTAGVALRFPRLIKFRDDKSWQDATSLQEVKELQALVE